MSSVSAAIDYTLHLKAFSPKVAALSLIEKFMPVVNVEMMGILHENDAVPNGNTREYARYCIL